MNIQNHLQIKSTNIFQFLLYLNVTQKVFSNSRSFQKQNKDCDRSSKETNRNVKNCPGSVDFVMVVEKRKTAISGPRKKY